MSGFMGMFNEFAGMMTPEMLQAFTGVQNRRRKRISVASIKQKRVAFKKRVEKRRRQNEIAIRSRVKNRG